MCFHVLATEMTPARPTVTFAAPMSRLLLLPSADADLDSTRLIAALRSRFNATEAPAVPRGVLFLRRLPGLRGPIREAALVHAFGMPALAAAVLGGARQIVFTPVGVPDRRAIKWLSAVGRHRSLRVVVTSDAVRRRMVLGGVPIDRVTLIRPGVDLSAVRTARDTDARQAIGLAEDDIALLLPLEQSPHSGHTSALWATSLLNVLNPRYRLVLMRTPRSAAALDDLRSRLIEPRSCVIADPTRLSIEQLLAAADVVLFPTTGPVPPLAVAMAMASGRPIVAAPTPQNCELLEDRHTALLVSDPSPRRLSLRLLDLFADWPLAQRLADRARAEAYENLTQAKMIELYRQFYAGIEGAASSASAGARHSTYVPIRVKPSET